MLLLTILSATVLAAASVPIARGLLSAVGDTRSWSVPLVAIPIALTLGWSTGRIVEVPIVTAIGLAVVAAALALQLVIDLTTHRLPREVSYVALVVFAATIPFAGGGSTRSAHALLGALVMTAISLGLVALTRGSLGMGDVHLSPLLGALAGWFGFLTAVGVAWVATAVSGGVVVAIGLWIGRLNRKQHVPYGPFLIAGALVACAVSAVGQ